MHTHAWTHTQTHAYRHTHAHKCKHTHIHTHTHTLTLTHTHTCINIYKYIHTHTHSKHHHHKRHTPDSWDDHRNSWRQSICPGLRRCLPWCGGCATRSKHPSGRRARRALWRCCWWTCHRTATPQPECSPALLKNTGSSSDIHTQACLHSNAAQNCCTFRKVRPVYAQYRESMCDTIRHSLKLIRQAHTHTQTHTHTHSLTHKHTLLQLFHTTFKFWDEQPAQNVFTVRSEAAQKYSIE